MKVRQLRDALEALATSRGDDDVMALAQLIAPLDDTEVSNFRKLLGPAVAKGVKAEETKAERARRAAEKAQQEAAKTEAVIARYVGELRSTKSNNSDFETVVKRIEGDRSIKPAHAEAIAHRFMSNDTKYKTKKAAMKAVLKRQITDKRATDRASQVSEIF